MVMIDPPPIMYGPPEAIRSWLEELATMPQQEPEVQRAIKEAKRWLKDAKSLDSNPGKPR